MDWDAAEAGLYFAVICAAYMLAALTVLMLAATPVKIPPAVRPPDDGARACVAART